MFKQFQHYVRLIADALLQIVVQALNTRNMKKPWNSVYPANERDKDTNVL